MSEAVETLLFKVSLSGSYWDKIPQYEILVNDSVVASGYAPADGITEEFTANVTEETSNLLKIKLINKTDSDVVENDDKTAIVKDMLLNIDAIEIDGIDLGQLKWSHSEFVATDASRPTLKSCVNLGWNGTYTIEFTSPFYLWLLENT